MEPEMQTDNRTIRKTLLNERCHIDFYEISIVSVADAGICIHC